MQKRDPQKIIDFGEQAVLIAFEPIIAIDLLKQIRSIAKVLNEKCPEKTDIQNTYSSILVNFSAVPRKEKLPKKPDLESWVKAIEIPKKIEVHQHELPVCYDEEFGLDLKDLAEEKEISVQKLTELHTQPDYTIYFTGFLPGFPYLGGLPKKLHHPRKENPRMKVPVGAVGIAGKQTGIYPQESAGGWQLIGNCPVPLFEINRRPPTPFQAGDRLQFKAVDRDEYKKIKREVRKNQYSLKSKPYEY